MARYCSIALLVFLGISCSQDRGLSYSPPDKNDVRLGGDGHPMNDISPDGQGSDARCLPGSDWREHGHCEPDDVCSGGDCVVGACNGAPIVVAGILDTSVAAVEFDSASVELRHKQDIDKWEDGCIVELNIHLKYGAGCHLDIRAGEAFGPDGLFQIQELTFLADSLCPSFPDALEGTYVDKGNMVVAGVQLEATEVPGHNASQSCVNTSFVIHLEGTLEEQQTGKTLAVNSTAITLTGDFSSAGSFALSCPCKPSCEGLDCGDDGCGGSCGTCPDGKSCQKGQCKVTCGDGQCGAGEDQCNCLGDCVGGCAGCCAGVQCKMGASNSACGKNGEACSGCTGGKTCLQGECSFVVWWKDPASNLTWQNPPAGNTMNWTEASPYCLDLELDGGGWRLPTIGEIRTLIRGCPSTESGGTCNINEEDCLAESCKDGSCSGCTGSGGPADGCYWPAEMQGECGSYWSSSVVDGAVDFVWNVRFDSSKVSSYYVNLDHPVRCVR